MAKDYSYWLQEKKKDNKIGLILVLIMLAGALGVRWWSDTHQPPVHPLKLTITEKDIPRAVTYSLLPDAAMSGQLVATDNMRALAQERSIEGGQTQWEMVSVQYRASSDSPWSAPPRYINPFPTPTPEPEATPTPQRTPRPLPYDLGIETGYLPYAALYHRMHRAGEWKITVRASRKYYDADTKEEWQGSAQHELIRVVKEDKRNAAYAAAQGRQMAAYSAAMERSKKTGLPEPTEIPPPDAHPFDFNKDYLAGMQWSNDNGEHWQDVPVKGQKGFPLTLVADTVTSFRIVKKNPREPWPDWYGNSGSIYSVLKWGGDIAPHEPPGEETTLQVMNHDVALDENDFATVTVTCGNTIKRQIRVVPFADVKIRTDSLETVAKNAGIRRVKLTAHAQWERNFWNLPTKFRFKAAKVIYRPVILKDGRRGDDRRVETPVGEINNPGPADDIVTCGAGNSAQATLTVPRGTGAIQVWALFLAPNGNEIGYEIASLNVPAN